MNYFISVVCILCLLLSCNTETKIQLAQDSFEGSANKDASNEEELVSNIDEPYSGSDQNSSGNNTSGLDIRTFIVEEFDNMNFSSRGWYDHNNNFVLTSDNCISGTSCIEYKFQRGSKGPISEGMRYLFDETDEIYLSYWVRFSDNWTGSNLAYHPHVFYFMTNLNSRYHGPASSYLTTYIEHNEGKPSLAIQDSQNIDSSKIDVNLTHITEERAVAGCNGDTDNHGRLDCYISGGSYRNGRVWKTDQIYFQDAQGKYYKGDWHFIEAYMKLNTIENGVGRSNGIMKYWYDGELLINDNSVLLRTASHPSMMFNQFLIGIYIGDGSPLEQTMWVDKLTIGKPITSAD